ncbi:MAG: glycosyltransferase [Actinomycetota bacterium]|nr:glycosyltransferase [Actinomycetota bacterium]
MPDAETGTHKAGTSGEGCARMDGTVQNTAERRAVAVVVLTWNARAYTQRCLAALRRLTTHPAWRLVVVDNGSTDGTVEWLHGQDWVEVVENGANLGFSRGCNRGIVRAGADEDVVLLNNDVVITQADWLERLQDAAFETPDAGVVGTRLVDETGRVAHTGTYMPPTTLWGQQMGGLELDIGQCRRRRPVEGVVFALVYLRRECIDKIGGLDEDFFAYYEDTDYCIRASRAGFEVRYAGDVCSVHSSSITTRENKVDFWSLFDQSARTFGRKWADWLETGSYDDEVVWHSVLNRAPGYALTSRKLMLALHFAGLRVAYREAYGLEEDGTGHLLLDDLVSRQPRTDVTQIAFCQADVFHRVEGKTKIGWTMLEVTGLPPEWVDGCNRMDEVWVPASFNVETFRASGVKVPIRVMPLGVDLDYFNPGITGLRPSNRFTFLSVFEWGERKGAEVLLRAFAEEFDENDDVMLLVSAYNRDPGVDVRREIAALDLPRCPPIGVMVNAEFADHQMGALYRSADCFVLPTRGEGFGMPVLEAMACGLPTIATAWSGPADFLHEGVGYPLQVASMIKAHARCPYYEGFEWADPDLDHLRHLMRRVADEPGEARARGLAASREVAANYSIEQVAARVKQRVLEL